MRLLTASSGLGTYVPCVQLHDTLPAGTAGIDVLESLYADDKLAQLRLFRERFQRDFRYALAAKGFLKLHSMADNLDPARAASQLARWDADGVRRFVVFSGFWLPLLREYRERVGGDIDVACVQLEAVVSPSWQAHLDDYPFERELVWLFGGPADAPVQLLGTPPADVTRAERVVVHGGGWQIGDHGDVVGELRTAGFDVLAGRPDPTVPAPAGGIEHFCVDPAWETWSRPGSYPPILADRGDGYTHVSDGAEHWLFGEIAASLAIVSKPGGGTLLDSLTIATPLITLTPYGDTEQANGELWQRLGFAIDFASWRDSGFAREPLIEMQARLQAARADLPTFAETIAPPKGDAHAA